MGAEDAERDAFDIAQQASAVAFACAGSDVDGVVSVEGRDERREDVQRFAQVFQCLVLQVEDAVGDAAVGDLEHVFLTLVGAQVEVAVKLRWQRTDGNLLNAVLPAQDGGRLVR